MLAMSNKDGDVLASVPGLAKMAGITLEETEDGIARFQQPDRYSRTPDFDGRRIETIDGGWHLLNHAKYRRLMSEEERREYNRKKQAEHRARVSARSSMTVNDSQEMSAMSAHTEANTDTEEEEEQAPASEVVSLWNSRSELSSVRAMTSNRKRAIKARMADPFFRQNWKSAFHKMLESPFLTGNNDRGWKADFDWFLKPESVTRIMEGKYDGQSPAQTKPKPRVTL